MAEVQKRRIRGLQAKDEVDNKQRYVDTRPLGKRLAATLRRGRVAQAVFAVAAVFGLILPALLEIYVLMLAPYALWFFTRRTKLSLRAPMHSGVSDWGSGDESKPKLASGIMYLGNEYDEHQRLQEEIWLNDDDARRHMMVLGSTGSGKTEALLGIAANALSWGSGFLFIDGKGDTALFSKVYGLCKAMGRTDDLLVANFLTGEGVYQSNTINPFAAGSASQLSEMLTGMLADGGSNEIFKQRAINMMDTLITVLVELRDKGLLLLDADTLRKAMNLDNIIRLWRGIDLQLDAQTTIKAHTYALSRKSRDNLDVYLRNLPAFSITKALGNKNEEDGVSPPQPQPDKASEQHNYLTMQYTQPLGDLTGPYGHIFDTPLGEIDMDDVVKQRRILVVMLPALEKSPTTVQNLGKLIVNAMKMMMGVSLGGGIEGKKAEIIDNKPTSSETPFVAIHDEVGYYTIEGMDVMAAQARSLGFSLVYAAQDIAAMQKHSEQVQETIQANCNTKVFMKVDDPAKTIDAFEKLAGEIAVSETKGVEGQSQLAGTAYKDSLSAAFSNQKRAHPLDLKNQKPGEAHLLHDDLFLRMRFFYPDPESNASPERISYNRCVRVAPPDSQFRQEEGGADRVWKSLSQVQGPDQGDVDVRGLMIASAFRAAWDHAVADPSATDGRPTTPTEMMCAALAALITYQQSGEEVRAQALAERSQADGGNTGDSETSPAAETAGNSDNAMAAYEEVAMLIDGAVGNSLTEEGEALAAAGGVSGDALERDDEGGWSADELLETLSANSPGMTPDSEIVDQVVANAIEQARDSGVNSDAGYRSLMTQLSGWLPGSAAPQAPSATALTASRQDMFARFFDALEQEPRRDEKDGGGRGGGGGAMPDAWDMESLIAQAEIRPQPDHEGRVLLAHAEAAVQHKADADAESQVASVIGADAAEKMTQEALPEGVREPEDDHSLRVILSHIVQKIAEDPDDSKTSEDTPDQTSQG